MKNKFKVFIAIIFSFVIICNTSVFAANVSISANTSVEVGNNVTISISVPGVTGKCTVTSSNPNIVSLSTGSIWVERGATSPIVGYTKGVGSATITVTPDTMADDNTGDDVSVAAKSITINVKEKYVPPANNTNTNSNTNTNTNTNTNANTSTNVNNTVTNKQNNNTTAVKNSNAFLSKLQVNVEGLTPNFNKNKYSYTLALNENVESVNVTAVAEDSKAKVSVSGNTDLKEGDNTISIVVTAENGVKKTYTIIATKSADPMKSDSYLANLIIKGCELSPVFSSEVFEYDLGVVSADKLEVFAYPKNEKAKVEIIGNDELVEGENLVKIKITSEDGTTTKEYTLKVKKEVKVVEENIEVNALAQENVNEVSKFEKIKNMFISNWLVIILFIFVVIEFIQILYLYCKYSKLKKIVNNKENEDENINSNEHIELNEQNEQKEIEEKDSDDVEKIQDVENNEIDNEVEKVEQDEKLNEDKEDISYETIMSKINELGNEVETKIVNEENKETRTRNGRKE